MLTIRFIRTGRRNQPFFRIVVTDKKNPPRGGRFLEIVGFFNPRTKERNIKAERAKYWLSVGAQTSDRVHNLLVSEKIIQGKKIDVHKKSKKKKESQGQEQEATQKQQAVKQNQESTQEKVKPSNQSSSSSPENS